jgi:hypothetical protein
MYSLKDNIYTTFCIHPYHIAAVKFSEGIQRGVGPRGNFYLLLSDLLTF